jgi:hypothetical protein
MLTDDRTVMKHPDVAEQPARRNHVKTQHCVLVAITVLLSGAGAGENAQSRSSENEIHAAITRSLRSVGYQVTERRAGIDAQVVALEYRDSDAYKPSSRMLFRVRSLHPWARDVSFFFRYWLIRETYDSEAQAEKRVGEYMVGYAERLAPDGENRQLMVSKTILRVDARRRASIVYLLVTDGFYTYLDDNNQGKILDTVLKLETDE